MRTFYSGQHKIPNYQFIYLFNGSSVKGQNYDINLLNLISAQPSNRLMCFSGAGILESLLTKNSDKSTLTTESTAQREALHIFAREKLL